MYFEVRTSLKKTLTFKKNGGILKTIIRIHPYFNWISVTKDGSSCTIYYLKQNFACQNANIKAKMKEQIVTNRLQLRIYASFCDY